MHDLFVLVRQGRGVAAGQGVRRQGGADVVGPVPVDIGVLVRSATGRDLDDDVAGAQAEGSVFGAEVLGMTPRQTIGMVITLVVVTGLVAGALGMPLGVALHGWVIPAMGDSLGLRLPRFVIAVYHWAELLPLALGGLLVATLGALLPAGWAARTRAATALGTG